MKKPYLNIFTASITYGLKNRVNGVSLTELTAYLSSIGIEIKPPFRNEFSKWFYLNFDITEEDKNNTVCTIYQLHERREITYDNEKGYLNSDAFYRYYMEQETTLHLCGTKQPKQKFRMAVI